MVPALVATFHLGFCEIAQRLFLGCFFQLLNLVALRSCFALKILHHPSESIPSLCNSQLIYYLSLPFILSSLLIWHGTYMFLRIFVQKSNLYVSTGHLPTIMVFSTLLLIPKKTQNLSLLPLEKENYTKLTQALFHVKKFSAFLSVHDGLPGLVLSSLYYYTSFGAYCYGTQCIYGRHSVKLIKKIHTQNKLNRILLK